MKILTPELMYCARIVVKKTLPHELVKAVEKLLGNPTEQQKTETTPNVEDWSRDVESTAKALEGSGEKIERTLSPKPTTKPKQMVVTLNQ